MTDSNGPQSKGIPSWQLAKEAAATVQEESQPKEGPLEAAPESRPSLIEKASKFLDDEEIRGASVERKTYFLQTKGLTDEEISDLLEEKNNSMEAEVVKDMDRAQEDVAQFNGSAPTIETSNTDLTDDYTDSEPPPSEKKEEPPIITYPEFLLHSQKPPPLITTGRLLTALYLASGTAATMYGLNNYVVEPMVESLSSARHTFFESAASNIDKLNEKLASTVSKIPDGTPDEEESDVADDASESSDPVRFFSRTIATQTSPRLSRSTSSTSLSEKATRSAVATHASHMSKIHDLLSDLKEEGPEASDPVKDNVQALREYLRSLPTWGRTGKTGISEGKGADSNNDGVTKVKAEIKSVKGALLSARNFPSGVTNR